MRFGRKTKKIPMCLSCFPILAAVARSLTAFKMELVEELIKYSALEVHASPMSGKIKSALQENRHTAPSLY